MIDAATGATGQQDGADGINGNKMVPGITVIH